MKNHVSLVGHLGGDPEVHRVGERSVAVFRVATTRRWKDRVSGERREATEWHSVEVWGRQAEVVGEHLTRGRLVGVEGRLQTDQWDDGGVRRERTKIVARDVLFLGGASRGRGKGEPEGDGDGVVPLPLPGEDDG